MAQTPSKMVSLGTVAPAFSLPDTVSGSTRTLEQLRGSRGTVAMFICNHCPYVKHVNDELVRVARDYQGRGVGFVAISSNDAEHYPDDGPDQMREVAKRLRYPFPYLYDESQDVARAYQAACTPDLFLFDSGLKLAYRGQLDESRPGKGTANGKDLRGALDALIAGQPVNPDQRPSVGCNIKWRRA
jgi:peroxiredoxin